MAKDQAKTKQDPEAELLLLKIICFLHPRYNPKIMRETLSNEQK